MTELIRIIIASIFIMGGLVSSAIGILGVYRFHFVMNRMHCSAILDTLGMTGIILGLMIIIWDWNYIPKLTAILLVLWIGSPISSHLVSRMELLTDETASEHLTTKEDDEHGSV